MNIEPGSYENADHLPVDPDLKAALLAEAGLGEWWQFDSEFAKQESGVIAQLAGLKTGALMAQATAANRATLAEQAGLGGYDAGVFDGSNDRYQSSYTPDFTAAGSLVVVAQTTNVAAAQAFAYQYTGSTQQTGILRTSTGNLSVVHRNSTVIAGNASSIPHGEFFLAILGVTGTRLRGKASSNPVTADTTVAGSPATGGLIIGANRFDTGTSPHNGPISDVMHWTIDLLDAANLDQLEMVYNYVRNTYGLDI